MRVSTSLSRAWGMHRPMGGFLGCAGRGGTLRATDSATHLTRPLYRMGVDTEEVDLELLDLTVLEDSPTPTPTKKVYRSSDAHKETLKLLESFSPAAGR
jgi:hypothetical protein